jgi:DHA2 family multidrug resistance protein
MAGMFAAKGVDLSTATQQGTAMLANQVRQSATVMAYADSFWILGVCICVSLLTLLILRKPPAGAAAMAADAH